MTSDLRGYGYAILSGFLAASAAFSAKFFSTTLQHETPSSKWMGIKLMVLPGYVAYVVINLLMWITFTAALRKAGRCITILALNSLANFGFSALFGFLCFGESLTMQWCLGMTFIFIGICTLMLES
ncbi:hypothetical protein CSKR_200420 [Clonorchis sinensis]|uniref:Uncharacterized protein n=2 Tax=Clonorchis sinensis TaxID=79923 RepID=A0A8T1MDF6_CLOSI|nr:hypothetical protein CSKR_200420 [Clonorchis sinensis]GAA57516.1 hypothetical protein CLF_112834 [Clonorchis sinensis]